jgi:hypothetical protein
MESEIYKGYLYAVGSFKFYVVRTTHFVMKLYIDQGNAQVFN